MRATSFAVVVILGLELLCIRLGADPQQSISVCQMEKTAIVEQDRDTKKLVASSEGNTGTIILAGLDTDSPTLRANAGEGKLQVLRRTENVIWLLEPPSDSVNLWTYFKKEKVIIQSKQYSLNGPFALLEIGSCK